MATVNERAAAILLQADLVAMGRVSADDVMGRVRRLAHPSYEYVSPITHEWRQLRLAAAMRQVAIDRRYGDVRIGVATDLVMQRLHPMVYGAGAFPCVICFRELAGDVEALGVAGPDGHCDRHRLAVVE